jgi:hypothetical protein
VRTVECSSKAGSGTRLHQRSANGIANEVVDEAWLTKADLGLGGMNVDINFLRRHLEEEEDDGIRRRRDDIAVGFAERVQDELVADETLIDEDVHRVAVQLLELGLGDEASDAEKTWFRRSVVEIALPRRRFGKASAGEVHLGCRGEHVVGGFLTEYLEESIRSVGDGWRGK